MKDTTMPLGEKIRQLRSERAWSQGELAARLGGDPGQISRFRRPERAITRQVSGSAIFCGNTRTRNSGSLRTVVRILPDLTRRNAIWRDLPGSDNHVDRYEAIRV